MQDVFVLHDEAGGRRGRTSRGWGFCRTCLSMISEKSFDWLCQGSDAFAQAAHSQAQRSCRASRGLRDCSLSREIGARIFSVNFGSNKAKPRLLRPLHIQGAALEIQRATLQALAGRSAAQSTIPRGFCRTRCPPFRYPALRHPCRLHTALCLAVYPRSSETFAVNLKVVPVDDILHGTVATATTDEASVVGRGMANTL